MEDYVFKIGLEHDEDLPPVDPSDAPKVALVRAQLQALLEVVILTVGGAEATIDGFRFIGEEAAHPIWQSTA